MQKITTIAAVLAVAASAACAPTPESIQPAYVSEVPYQSWSCQQLGEEMGRLNNALATASAQQNSARTNDTVGIILIGLPVGSMSGQSIAPQIARYKGEQEAINRAMIRGQCGEMMRTYPPSPSAPPVTSGEQPAPKTSKAGAGSGRTDL